MLARVKALEDTMTDIKITLARIDERMSHLATKEDVSKIETSLNNRIGGVETALSLRISGVETALSSRLSGVESGLKGTLNFWQFLIVVGGLLAIVLRWPDLFRMAGFH